MTHIQSIILSAWFKPGEQIMYFGSRSEAEVSEIISTMRNMTSSQREAFKRELRKTHWSQVIDGWHRMRQGSGK